MKKTAKMHLTATALIFFILVLSVGLSFKGNATDLSEFEITAEENGKITITAYNGTDSNVIIPDGVSAIADKAFYGNKTVTSLTMCDSLTEVGTYAFRNCTNLKSIKFSDNVKRLSSNLFYGCTSLTDVYLPSALEEIGNYAFRGCTALTAICLPDSVTSLGTAAFYGCNALTTVDTGNGLSALPDKCFHNCSSLKELRLGNGFIEINSNYFSDTLEKVEIGDGLTAIPDSCFASMTNLKSIRIGSCLETIGNSAFISCTTLSDVSLPSGVTSIGSSAFESCTSLENIDLPDCLSEISSRLFYGCNLLGEIGAIPDNIVSIGEGAFYDCILDGDYTIPSGVEIISDSAFYQCEGITSLTISSNLKTIGASAFTRAYSLTDVYFDGTSEQWSQVTVGSGNDIFLGADFHFLADHEHNYISNVTKEPACQEEGKRTYTCSCGDSYTETLSALNHMEEIIPAVAATCSSTGLTEGKKCSACGEILLAQTTTDMLPHTESEWITDSYPTCTREGSKHIECTVCHKQLKTDAIEKLNHSETIIPAVAATCSSTGLTEGKKCSVCGEVLVAQTTTDILPHISGGWITDSAPSCTSEGSRHTECTVCHILIQTDSIAMLNHSEIIIAAVAATCSSTGLTEGKKCSTCGEILLAQTTTDMLPHTESEWITDSDPTCTNEGNKHIECTVCHKQLETNSIQKLNHIEIVLPAVTATCTSTGLTEGKKCSTCGEILLAQTTTDMLPHTESEWITDSYPSCTSEGSRHIECTVCYTLIQTDSIAMLNHSETIIPAVTATCTSTGLTEGKKCSVCGRVLLAQTTTNTLPHTSGEWIIDSKPTCTKNGNKHIECKICNKIVKHESIPKTNHDDKNADNLCDQCGININPSYNCTHMCHKTGFNKIIWEFIRFFLKLFRTGKICDCGEYHY